MVGVALPRGLDRHHADAVTHACQGRICLREHRTACLEGDLKIETIHCGESHALDVQMSGDGSVLFARNGSDLLLHTARNHRIDANDGILRMDLVPSQINFARLVQDRLDLVDGRLPVPVLDIAEGSLRIQVTTVRSSNSFT
jgi:hypothetical protein